MGTPYGPHRINKVRQVAIPAELMREIGLEVNDKIHFRQSDHDPHVIEILPSDVLNRRLERGTQVEAAERVSQPQTLDDEPSGQRDRST